MNASAKPDPSLFSVNERPNEYEARFRIEGEITAFIRADNLEDAKAKAQAMAEDEEFGHELDSVEDVDISRVWKSVPMYRILRNGKAMQTSYLVEGDLPRDPTETGF